MPTPPPASIDTPDENKMVDNDSNEEIKKIEAEVAAAIEEQTPPTLLVTQNDQEEKSILKQEETYPQGKETVDKPSSTKKSNKKFRKNEIEKTTSKESNTIWSFRVNDDIRDYFQKKLINKCVLYAIENDLSVDKVIASTNWCRAAVAILAKLIDSEKDLVKILESWDRESSFEDSIINYVENKLLNAGVRLNSLK